MPDKPHELMEAFREDHARLGRGFHDLSRHLRAGDKKAVRATARWIDEIAGAHIAFEEKDFYPLLAAHLGQEAVDRMFADHQRGLGVLLKALALPDGAQLTSDVRERLLSDSEAMESHIADCGNLFATILHVSPETGAALYARLIQWRKRRPRWTRFAEEGE